MEDLKELEKQMSIWEKEKALVNDIQALKEKIDLNTSKAEQAQREGDYQVSAKIRYSDTPEIEKQIEILNEFLTDSQFLKQVVETLLTDDQHLSQALTDTLTLQVYDLGAGHVFDPPAHSAQAHAPFQILETHEDTVIETSRRVQRLTSDHQAGTGNPTDVTRLPVMPAAKSKKREHSVQ